MYTDFVKKSRRYCNLTVTNEIVKCENVDILPTPKKSLKQLEKEKNNKLKNRIN